MTKVNVIVIVGPTASGKSDLAIKLAKKLNGEIISADSRQVYRGMNIGTGKVTAEEQKMAVHHLLDAADPRRQFSVERFKKLGQEAIKEITAKSKLPIIVGGTGFYIDALIYDQKFPEVPPNSKLRAKLAKQSAEQLFIQLQESDPDRAASIDPHNKRRLVRALEIIAKLGKVPNLKKESQYNVLWLGVNWPKEELDKRIKIRLDKRFKQGMIEEIKKLRADGVSFKRLENFGLEYRWIGRYLQDKIGLEEMKNALYKDIIHYSKRQMTWFKRNRSIHWMESPSASRLPPSLDALLEPLL